MTWQFHAAVVVVGSLVGRRTVNCDEMSMYIDSDTLTHREREETTRTYNCTSSLVHKGSKRNASLHFKSTADAVSVGNS